MNPITCEEVRELAVELALDVVPADERNRALAHLDDCPSCRELVDGYVRTGDSLLLALPEADVPDNVSAAIRATKPVMVKPSRWKRAPMLAAAAVLLLVVVAGVLVARNSDNAQPQQAAALVSRVGSARLGSVTVEGGDKPWMWLTISGDVPDGTYRCELVLADGSTSTVGRVTVTDRHGAWGASITADLGDIVGVNVVAADGAVVATATL